MALYQQSFSVFSTYVEVILAKKIVWHGTFSFLHVCGGDPDKENHVDPDVAVFSTYVEVILVYVTFPDASPCFLHVCGGDPNCKYVSAFRPWFSPRMWR